MLDSNLARAREVGQSHGLYTGREKSQFLIDLAMWWNASLPNLARRRADALRAIVTTAVLTSVVSLSLVASSFQEDGRRGTHDLGPNLGYFGEFVSNTLHVAVNTCFGGSASMLLVKWEHGGHIGGVTFY